MRPAIQSVHNLRALFWFRALAFVIMAAGAAPMFFMRSDSPFLFAALIASFLLVIVSWNLVKPGYTAVEVAVTQILISTEFHQYHRWDNNADQYVDQRSWFLPQHRKVQDRNHV